MKKEFNEYKIFGDKTYIIIQNRLGEIFKTIIDTKNLILVKKASLRFHAVWKKDQRSYYARATKYLETINSIPKYEMVYLHHIIKPLPKNTKLRTDHKNHDTLDNTEKNLAFVSVRGNGINRKGINLNNKSGYRNVCWIRDCWKIQLQINGTNYRFPEKFKDVREAGRFAEEMRKIYYSE